MTRHNYVDLFGFSEKYTRFCQWKNLELNIQVSGNVSEVYRMYGPPMLVVIVNPVVAQNSHRSFSQILDGALCRAFKVQREFVSSLQVTHLHPVWDLLLPLA